MPEWDAEFRKISAKSKKVTSNLIYIDKKM